MCVVRVLSDVSVRVLVPPRWSVGGRSENSASIEGFVNGRAMRNDRHFGGLREAVGTWFDRGVVACVYKSWIATLVKFIGSIRGAHLPASPG